MDPKPSSDNFPEFLLENQPKEEEFNCYLCSATYEKGIYADNLFFETHSSGFRHNGTTSAYQKAADYIYCGFVLHLLYLLLSFFSCNQWVNMSDGYILQKNILMIWETL